MQFPTQNSRGPPSPDLHYLWHAALVLLSVSEEAETSFCDSQRWKVFFFLTLFAVLFLAAKINETDAFGPGDDDEIQFDDLGDDDEDIDEVSSFNLLFPKIHVYIF